MCPNKRECKRQAERQSNGQRMHQPVSSSVADRHSSVDLPESKFGLRPKPWWCQLDAALARPLMLLVRLYQLVLSAWMGNQCRFHPSCSNYSLDALRRHGACRGLLLTAARLMRCHPFSAGGFDPVPTSKKCLSSTQETNP